MAVIPCIETITVASSFVVAQVVLRMIAIIWSQIVGLGPDVTLTQW